MARRSAVDNASTAQLATQVSAALSMMSPSLQSTYARIRNALETTNSNLINRYHEIGGWLRSVEDSRELDHVAPNGEITRGIDLVAKALGLTRKGLTQYIRFNRMYSDAQLSELVSLRNERVNFSLTWSHVLCLLPLKSASERTRFARQAIQERLKPRELQKLVQKELGSENAGRGGRPVAVPPTLSAALRQIISQCDGLVQKKQQAWASDAAAGGGNLMEMLAQLGVTGVDQDHLALINQSLQSIEILTAEISELRPLLQRAAAYAEQLLEQSAEAATAEATEAEETEAPAEAAPTRRRTRRISPASAE